MKEKLNQLFSHDITKPILWLVLFLISGWTTYQACIVFVPIVTHYGRGALEYLPTILVGGVPLFTLIISLIYCHVFNLQTKWKVMRVYAFTLCIAMPICIILHCVMCSVNGIWKIGTVNVSRLFPYDMLVFMILSLVIGLFSLRWVIKNKAFKDVEKTSDVVIRKRAYVALSFVVAIGSWYLGDFYSVFKTIGPRVDSNWPFMIPVFLAMLIPTLLLVLYFIYKHKTNDDNRRKTHFLFNVIGTSVIAVLGIWTIVGVIVNPRLVAESLTNFFLLGMAAKIPFGLFIVFAGCIAILIVSYIRYFKAYKKHE